MNLFDLNQSAMRDYFAGMAEPPFRAGQVMRWVYHQGITGVGEMTNLSKQLRARLAAQTHSHLPKIIAEQLSQDGTRKWLMQIEGGGAVESVFIPEAERGTLCISSQAGCALNCAFCSTGKQGYNRNLSVAEIIGQLWQANKTLGYFDKQTPDKKTRPQARIISNVVMMGMGEPLLNFDNVIAAMDLMSDDLGFGLANKRITLSTAGVVPGIYKLARQSNVSLAISLHAVSDALRDVLLPINQAYPIAELLKACRYYSDMHKGASVTFEYIMLHNVNDTEHDARALARLMRTLPAKVNLIPFNDFPGGEFACSPRQKIDKFRDILLKSDIITITRKTRGDDINAACGQLVGKVIPRAGRYNKQQVMRSC